MKSCFFLIGFLLLGFFNLQAQEKSSLKPGVSKQLVLRKGAEAGFRIFLDSGKTYSLHAEQKGIDVELILLNAQGDTIGYKDSPNGLYGGETLIAGPSATGEYQWQIKPLLQEANAASGKVVVRWQEKAPLPPPEILNRRMTPAQMLHDLTVFRNIRQQANSGFYRYRSPRQMDSIYQWAAIRCRKPLRLTEFYKHILTLTDFEGSNHNSTDLPEELIAYLPSGNHFVSFYASFVDGAIVVNNDSLALPVGSRIYSVNGRDEARLRRDFSRYYTTDGYNQTRKHKATAELSFGARYLLEYGAEDSFRIVYSRPFSTVRETLTLPGMSLAEKAALYRRRHSLPFENTLNPHLNPKYSFRKISDKTALLSIRVFDMAYGDEDPQYAVYRQFLDSVFRQLQQDKTPNLIVDIRNNPGGSGSNSETTFSYLTAGKSFRENTGAHILFRKIPFPQYFNWSSTDPENRQREQADREAYLQKTFPRREGAWYGQDTALNPLYRPHPNRFTGKLVLLIDENVGSAASHFAAEVKGHTHATVIGMETTGGYYGHNGHYPVEYRLPESGIISRFSIVWVEQDAPYLPDQPYGRGIMPHKAVMQSLDDFLKNEDTQLKAALRYCEP